MTAGRFGRWQNHPALLITNVADLDRTDVEWMHQTLRALASEPPNASRPRQRAGSGETLRWPN
jgi:hypothetical protein